MGVVPLTLLPFPPLGTVSLQIQPELRGLSAVEARRPYTAVRRISQATSGGQGTILSADEMDSLWGTKPQRYLYSIGESLNLGVNELADVLHRFYVRQVSS